MKVRPSSHATFYPQAPVYTHLDSKPFQLSLLTPKASIITHLGRTKSRIDSQSPGWSTLKSKLIRTYSLVGVPTHGPFRHQSQTASIYESMGLDIFPGPTILRGPRPLDQSDVIGIFGPLRALRPCAWRAERRANDVDGNPTCSRRHGMRFSVFHLIYIQPKPTPSPHPTSTLHSAPPLLNRTADYISSRFLVLTLIFRVTIA